MKPSETHETTHPLLNFIKNKSFIDIGYGRASYHMSRGTFKTKDRITDKHRLFYHGYEQNRHVFTDGKVYLYLDVIYKEHVSIKFHLDGHFNRLSFYLPSDEHVKFYGCGEQFSTFNLKGKRVPIWVSEHHSVKKIIFKYLREKIWGTMPNYVGKFKHQQTYFAQPTFLSSKKYAVHVDTSAYATFHFKKHHTILSFREIPKEIFLFQSDQYLDLSAKLSAYLGRQPILPSWTEQGAILAIQGGTDIIRKKIEHATSNGIAISGVWAQDWSGHLETSFGYQVYWNWEKNEALYHDLPELINELKEKNIRFLGYINTF